MCDAVRQQPDGEDEDEDDELDPRIEIELEKLNKASIEINILEKELDEARAIFRQRLTDAAKQLKQLAKSIGNNIDKARPYFEALSQSKKAQADCQDAAITYDRACELHKGARDTIAVAEEKMMNNPGMFDMAWQEMMNNANIRIMEAEKEKLIKEAIHREATMAYVELQQRAAGLEKKLRKTVNKARPYFEQRSYSLGQLEIQKKHVQDLENAYAAAKKQYAESLRNLEVISEEIHTKRNEKYKEEEATPEATPSFVERGECIGAEDDQPRQPTNQSRRRSEMRRMSAERIKNALVRQRAPTKTSLGRYRHSLLLDLDVDLDLDDSDFSDDTPKSPGSKSIDIGCVNMKYYDDYQVLDVLPFLERERHSSVVKRQSFSRDEDQLRRRASDGFSDSDFSDLSTPLRSRSASEFSVISTHGLERAKELHRCNTAPTEMRRHSRPVIITDDDIQKELRDYSRARMSERKESRAALTSRFSLIQELDDGEDCIDTSDNVALAGGSFTEVKREDGDDHRNEPINSLREPNCLEVQDHLKQSSIDGVSDIKTSNTALQNCSEEIQNDLKHILTDGVSYDKTDNVKNFPDEVRSDSKQISKDTSYNETSDTDLKESPEEVQDDLKQISNSDTIVDNYSLKDGSSKNEITNSSAVAKES